MKTKTIITLFAILNLTGAAFAVKGGEGNNTQCNGVGNANSPCNPQTNTPPVVTSPNPYNNDININNTNRISDTFNSSINNRINNSAASESVSRSSSNASSNSSAGGGSAVSGGNELSNEQEQNTNNNSGATGNTTNVSGGSTNIVTNIPRQAAPLPASVQVQAVGTSGGNFAISTPFGGASIGFNKTTKEAKRLMESQTEETYQRANTVYVENVIRACGILSEDDCELLKSKMVERF